VTLAETLATLRALQIPYATERRRDRLQRVSLFGGRVTMERRRANTYAQWCPAWTFTDAATLAERDVREPHLRRALLQLRMWGAVGT
jgi:hypothetical protein